MHKANTHTDIYMYIYICGEGILRLALSPDGWNNMYLLNKQNGMNANVNSESIADLIVCQLNELLVRLILTGCHHDHTVHVCSMDIACISFRIGLVHTPQYHVNGDGEYTIAASVQRAGVILHELC